MPKKPIIKSEYIDDTCPLCHNLLHVEIIDSPEKFSDPEAIDISELRTRRYCNGPCGGYKLYD